MKHIDIYMLNTLFKEQLQLSDKVIVQHLNENGVLPLLVVERDLKFFMEHPPSEKHVIHALKALGYQTKFISEYLKIPQPNVSYHLKNPPKDEYINRAWMSIKQYQLRQKDHADYLVNENFKSKLQLHE